MNDTMKIPFVEKDRSDPTINFMYFIHNFNSEQLYQVIDATNLPEHFRNKYRGYTKHAGGNGTEGLITMFMNMSTDTQKLVIDKINEIYYYGGH